MSDYCRANCPHCNHVQLIDKEYYVKSDGEHFILLICTNCDGFSWLNEDGTVDASKLKVGADIILHNQRNERNLEFAKIIDKSYKHYRICFGDGLKLWVPEHWICETPEELL